MFRKHLKRSTHALAALALAVFAASCSDSDVLSPSFNAKRNVLPSVGPFTWLAPLGNGAANPATFDAQAVTRVEVCTWVSNACSGTPVAAFSPSPAPGEGLLTKNTTAGRYEATFNLLNSKFTTRKTYRIRALQGTSEVGAILVDVVRGRWALTRTDGTLAPLVATNDLKIQFHVAIIPPPLIKVNEVESNGGTPGDWVEFYNAGVTNVDLSGFVFKDNDDTHIYEIPTGTTIAPGGYLVLEEAQFGFGLGGAESARLYDLYGNIVDQYSWLAHAATTYGRCPNGTGAVVTMTTVTKGAVNDCSVPNSVKFNEVESSGGTPGDWAELYNSAAVAVDISGFVFKDNDDTHVYILPAGSVVPPGGYFLIEEAQMGFGLGSPDAVRLFDQQGTLVDSYTWTPHATTTYGRCPNGTGAFVTMNTTTKGAANNCGAPQGPVVELWPGLDNTTPVDVTGTFSSNLSGLSFEAGATDVLWAARNGPGSIYRMIFNGSAWVPDANNGWVGGKLTKYTDGTANLIRKI